VTFAFGWILRTDGRREVVLCILDSQLELGVGPRSRTYGAEGVRYTGQFQVGGPATLSKLLPWRKVMRNFKIVAYYPLLKCG
jgi:hypothetical protein